MIFTDTQETTRTIAHNIAYYRKIKGLTQAELAEVIAYSDKSVSKWERGESVPDIHVLLKLAETFDISLNDLVLPAKEVKAKEEAPVKSLREKTLIPVLSVGLVYLVAAICFFVLKITMPELERTWLIFLYGLPVSCVVLIVFMNLWWSNLLRCISVSALIWSCAICTFCTFPQTDAIRFIFIIASIMQIITVLWYIMITKPRKKG